MREASPSPHRSSAALLHKLAVAAALLWALAQGPAAFAQAPLVACEHGICFRFPGEDPSYFKPSTPGPSGPYHFDNGCAGIDGPCYCSSYWGADFDHCYGGHLGTDFMLDGWFRTMRREIEVVAPALGEVIAVDDSHYDKCHFSPRDLLFDPTHDGNYCGWEVNPETGVPEERDVVNNYIVIRHFNGRYYVYSRILHIMQGSVPQWIKDSLAQGGKPRVECGERIAYVGSAGKSYAPHIHFEVRFNGTWDTAGQYYYGDIKPAAVDPYCGPYLAEGGRTGTFWTELPDPGPGEDSPVGLPGLSCQEPYDPTRYPDLAPRCVGEGTGR